MNQLRMRLIWKENEGSGADYVPTGDTFNDSTFAQWNVGSRDLCMRVLMQKAVYPSDADPYYEYTMFDDETIVSYTTNEGGTDGFGIGSSIAASYTLILDNSSHQYMSADFTNTRFAAAIGIKVNGHVKYEPFGVWSVTDVDAAERSSVVTIQGMDMLGFYYDDTFWPFADAAGSFEIFYGQHNYITEMLDAITQVWSDIPWGLNIGDDGNVIADPTDYPLFDWKLRFPIASVLENIERVIPERLYIAAAKAGITRRQIIAWAATMMGTFVRMERDGSLSFINYRYQVESSPTVVDTDTYYTYTQDGVENYYPKYVTVWYFTDDTMEETSKITTSNPDNEPLKPSNSLEIEANPMFVADSAAGVRVRAQWWLTTSRKYSSMTVSFVGAPQIVEGWGFNVRDLSSTSQSDYQVCMPTRISATYDGGFSMTVESKFPSDNTAYSSSFNSSTTLLTYTKELAYGRANQAAYSTDEQVTGQRWIDGKPIYRYTAVFNASIGSSSTIIHTIPSGHDKIIRLSLLMDNIRPVPYWAASSYWASIYINGNNIRAQAGSSEQKSHSFVLIMEYTRT